MDPRAVAEAIDQLADEYRTRCLWSLRLDYYPRTLSEQLHVLDTISRHADVDGFRRASSLRQWLSQNSNAASVAQ
jgi:hypothetical protein